MNKRIAILRKSLTVITQSLSVTEVKVTQAGLEAWVRSDATGKPIHVNLPYVPDNADDSLIDAIQGFLDHEVAHILFTDFKVTLSNRNKKVHALTNILEDARIEKEMAKKYRGCGVNLKNTSDFFLEQMIQPEFDKLINAKAPQEQMIGALITPLLRSMSGQSRHEDFIKDKIVHIADFYEKIKDLAPDIENLGSTEEAMHMAKIILKRIEEPKSESKNEDKSESSLNADSESQIDSLEEQSDGEDKSKCNKESQDASKNLAEGDDESENNNELQGEDGDKGQTRTKEKMDSKNGAEACEAPISNLDISAILSAIDKDAKNDFDKALSQKMGEQVAMAAKSSDYLIYSHDQDKIEILHIGKSFQPSMFSDISDKVDAMVGQMAKDLERAMIARSKAVWENGLRKGRMNASALSRLRTGDDRIFRQRHESTTNDVAVSLVVDASGSMSGSKIHTATASAYALSSVLDRLKISNEVICFTTAGMPTLTEAKEQEKKYGIEYSRYEALYMPILKTYEERLNTETKKRFGWLPHSKILANNVDGECIEIAFQRLMARKEKGKIMIVLSDGCPSARGKTSVLSLHLKDTVKKIEKTGTKVIGIGIQSDEVRQYYSKNIVVNNIDDLPKGVILELRNMLMSKN